jgi:hypothetical protein
MRKIGSAAVMLSAIGIVTSAAAVNQGVASLTEKRGLSPIILLKKSLGGLTPSVYAAQLAGKSVTLTTDSKVLCY